jgi:polyhydroxyalkanoate synthesis regulator phasin
MAERRRTGQGKSGRAKRTSSGRTTSSRSGRGRSSSASRARTASARSRSTGRKRQPARRAPSGGGTAARRDVSAKSIAEFREMLRRNLFRPLDLLILSRERIEEVLNDAVERGRVTADDAQDLAAGLIQRGRRQTNDVLKDLEQLLGRGRDEIEGRTSDARRAGTDAARRARQQVEGAAGRARSRATRAADPAVAQADRIRRAARVGPSFPITGYEDLTAGQVQSRLGALTPAELRKVRDYERRHGNRKSVLNAIESRLG